MLSVTLHLERMHCNEQYDNWGSSEPYLWTVFFQADADTFVLPVGNHTATYTPHSNSDTRDMYRDDVLAGEDVDIPESIGTHTMILDGGSGGQELGFAGMVFVLMEEDSTWAHAIRAGHQALAEAADVALNNWFNSPARANALAPPTDPELQAIADQIEGEVKEAIEGSSHLYDFLLDHDDFFGHGVVFFSYQQLSALASQTNPQVTFFVNICKEWTHTHDTTLLLPYPTPPPQPETHVNDYDIFGRMWVQDLARTPGPNESGFRDYLAAVEHLKRIDAEMRETLSELPKASRAKKEALLAKLRFQRRTVRPLAVKAVGSTRAEYSAGRDRFTTDIGDYLKSKKELTKARAERIAKAKPNPFRSKANVVRAQAYSPAQEKKRS